MNTAQYPLISDQISRPALEVVLAELEKVLAADVPGAICEFGCYIGTTSLFIRRVAGETRPFHVYDSFAGLPPKTTADNSAIGIYFQAGELAVSKKQFLLEFQKAKLRPPIVHKGWFHQLSPADVPAEISFAFLDGDFYESIMDSLKLAWPRLSVGGTVAIDDYNKETLPGVARAVHDFFNGQPPTVRQHHNIGIIHK